MTSYLCSCIGVSKSGYYNYLNNEDKRIERDNKDQKDFDLILKAYKFKKRKKGARQIMMVLDNEFNVHFNLKKIRRLMKKYGLKCPIRQANPYRRMMKATQEHTTCENIVNRLFKTGIPYNVLLTDITYLFYGDNKKCYLSTIKDAETNEILAYYISENMTLDISDAGSNHFRLEGIYHDYVIYYNHTQERPEFVKCKLTDIRYTTYGDTGGSTYAGTIKNAMFYHCKVSSSFKCGEACSATIINSYIACPYCVSATTSVLDVHNSVLINTGNTYDNMRLYNSTISNSVLASSCEFNSTTTFNNCLLPNTYHPDESKNTYISYEKVRPSDVFKTYNNTSSFWYSSTETFELRPEYNSIYGMYSGDFPYSPRLSGPHIQLMEVAPRTSDAGTLNVRIKVENTIE